MNKKEFIQYIKTSINNLSIEKQIEILKKIQEEYIPSTIKEILKNKIFCRSCKKYSNSSKFKIITKQESRIKTTYTDAGYGDNDMYGEVEYLVKYRICPLCGFEEEIDKTYLRTLWEKGRYD
jgi:hypothetical protein